MAATAGRAFVVKLGGNTPTSSPQVLYTADTYAEIGGFRSNSLTINNESVDVSTKTTGAFRKLLRGAGLKMLSVSGSGVFEDSAAESTMLSYAVASDSFHPNIEITIPGAGTFTGVFQITSLEYSGEHNGEATYSITLESDGSVSFTAA